MGEGFEGTLRVLEELQEGGGSSPQKLLTPEPVAHHTAPASSVGVLMPYAWGGRGGAAESSLMKSSPRTVLSHASHYSDRNSKSYKKNRKPKKPLEEARQFLALYGTVLAEHRCRRAGAAVLKPPSPSPVTPRGLCSDAAQTGRARRGDRERHLPPFKSADAPTYWKLSMLMTSMMGDTTRVLSCRRRKEKARVAIKSNREPSP